MKCIKSKIDGDSAMREAYNGVQSLSLVQDR
jgi:hypothetical protein